MSVVIFLVVLSFLVVIHELGHLLAARWAGMKVDEFGVGYPPRAKSLFTWKETLFTLNWIPFGGFVQIQGENGYLDDAPAKPGSFASAVWYKQLVVILAGVVVNFLFGALAFAGIFSYTGIPDTSGGLQIQEVAQNSPASEANLEVDTFIVGLQAQEVRADIVERISSTSDLLGFIAVHRGSEVTLYTAPQPCSVKTQWEECLASATQASVYLRTPEETPQDQGSMGIAFESFTQYQFYPWYEMPFRGMAHGFSEALALSREILGIFEVAGAQLFNTGSTSIEVAGPVGIAHQVQEQQLFAGGVLSILSFTAVISINLAVMNLLPIPALDGGRAVFIILRAISSSKIIKTAEYYVNYAGYALLLALIIGITFKDVARIIL